MNSQQIRTNHLRYFLPGNRCQHLLPSNQLAADKRVHTELVQHLGRTTLYSLVSNHTAGRVKISMIMILTGK